MGAMYSCDYCGEIIEDERDKVTMLAIGGPRGVQRYYHRNVCIGTIEQILDAAARVYQGLPVDSKSTGQAAVPETVRERYARERNAWSNLPVHELERYFREALGEDCLTTTELWKRVQAGFEDGFVSRTAAASITKRLFEAGDIDRVSEDYRGRYRWRWFWKSQLEGPIVELQRQFDSESPAG